MRQHNGGKLNGIPRKEGQIFAAALAQKGGRLRGFTIFQRRFIAARPLAAALALVAAFVAAPAAADYRITRDHGGLVEEYKTKYAKIRDRGERVIIDGICNSACTLLLGIVPLNRICVTPKASLGFHEAYFDKSWTFGMRVTSYAGTADLLSYYPPTVKDWIRQHGGLTPEMKHVKNGPELWAMLDPCPDEF